MTPTEPTQTDQEILENSIDNTDSTNDEEDFNKELPYESEYYRTSTDRDEFVRPLPGPEENEIDDGEGGIDLDESFSWNEETPDCTFNIFIQKFFESIDRLEIKLEGLKLKPTAKSNLTLDEFVHNAQIKLLENFKGKNLTSELVSDVIDYLRKTFMSTYGYGDYCGVSTNVITYFMRNETTDDSYELHEMNETSESNEEMTDNPVEVDSSTQIEGIEIVESETEADQNVESATEAGKDIEIESETETATDINETDIETATETEYSTEYSNAYSTEFSHISSDLVDVEVTDSDIVEVTDSDVVDAVDVTTESYHSEVLKRPKLAEIIQDSIAFYKALHNWKFPPPSEF